MERLTRLVRKQQPAPEVEYEPIRNDALEDIEAPVIHEGRSETPFSWLEYSVYCLIGIAMLWAWCVSS